MDIEEIDDLGDFFDKCEVEAKSHVVRVSLDMWGEKSTKSHKKSMAINKFLKPFRLSLMKIIIDTLSSEKIDIMVYAGTALAVWRDQGSMIPHDHDIDLAILESDFLKVINILNNKVKIFIDTICPFTQEKWFNDDLSEQVLYNQVGVKRIKVYFQESYLKEISQFDKKMKKLLLNYDRTKLFIDIFTLQLKPDTNDLRVTWNIKGVYNNDRKCFPTDIILPMKEYLFESMVIKGPRDIHSYLKIEYGYLNKDCKYDPESQLYVKLTDKEIDLLPTNIQKYMSS